MEINGTEVTFTRARDSWKRLLDAIPKGKLSRVIEDAMLVELIMGWAFVADRELTQRRLDDHKPHA